MNICLNCGIEHRDTPPACPDCGGPVVAVRPRGAGDTWAGRELGGKYVILAALGRGGMGSVYQAKHRALDKLVAIKLMNVEIAENEAALMRFYSEAKNAARLAHPNNVKVFDFGHEPDGVAYIVMELVNGRPLSYLRRPMSVERTLRLASQIASALQEAHDLGLVHRDLKPDNVMVSEIDGADFGRVVDYGIAKLANSSTGITSTGMIVGTPEYIAPEQAMGERVDHRCDIYALGIMLYELLTGHLPFKAESPMGLAYAHIHREPKPPSDYLPLPPVVERLVLRCMAKSPSDRPATMEEVRRRFDAILDGDPRVHDDATLPNLADTEPEMPAGERPVAAADTDPDPPSTHSLAERLFGSRRVRAWAAGLGTLVVLVVLGAYALRPLLEADPAEPIDVPAPAAAVPAEPPAAPIPTEAAPSAPAAPAAPAPADLAARIVERAEALGDVFTTAVANGSGGPAESTSAPAEEQPVDARLEAAAREVRESETSEPAHSRHERDERSRDETSPAERDAEDSSEASSERDAGEETEPAPLVAQPNESETPTEAGTPEPPTDSRDRLRQLTEELSTP